MAKFWDGSYFTNRPGGIIPGCFGKVGQINYPATTGSNDAELVQILDAEDGTSGITLNINTATTSAVDGWISTIKAWAASIRTALPDKKFVYYTQLFDRTAFMPVNETKKTNLTNANTYVKSGGMYSVFDSVGVDNYHTDGITNFDGMSVYNRDLNRTLNADKDGQTWCYVELQKHPSDDPARPYYAWGIIAPKLRLLAALFDNVVFLTGYDLSPFGTRDWEAYPDRNNLIALIAELNGSSSPCELKYTNIALRALNESPVLSLDESPMATECRDRLLEISQQQQAHGDWFFLAATHKISVSGGNQIPWERGETIKETTSNAEMRLIAVDAKTLWVKATSGTPIGGYQLTGQNSGAIRYGSTLVTLPTDEAFGMCDVPPLFAKWIAEETGLDMERQYKRSAVDDQILSQRVNRARNEFKDWDAMHAQANVHNLPGPSAIGSAFTRGPGGEEDE